MTIPALPWNTLYLAAVYMTVINSLTFVLFGIDKRRAKHAQWRIPEGTLIGLALLGGSLGAWLGMAVWHHKTQHKKFKYGIPLILLAQIVAVIMIQKSLA
jgi:uncharacterized membrane protein YsdA (DUF1294 family)